MALLFQQKIDLFFSFAFSFPLPLSLTLPLPLHLSLSEDKDKVRGITPIIKGIKKGRQNVFNGMLVHLCSFLIPPSTCAFHGKMEKEKEDEEN
jgi:hypothetical protein